MSYFYLVQKRKKVISGLILCSYLLMIAHFSVPHFHSETPPDSAVQIADHHEENHHDTQEEHEYHGGLIHYLSHIFDDINHSDDTSDDHFLSQRDIVVKRLGDNPVKFSEVTDHDSESVAEVDAAYLSSPPLSRIILLRIHANTPLRAPPAIS